VTGKTSISVDLTPLSPCPTHPGLTFVTNAYHVTADAPLVKDMNVVMRFSDVVPAPSFIYFAASPAGPWKSIGGHDGQPFTFVASSREFGYFAAGYPEGAVTSSTRNSASQLLPIAVAILIVGVLVAGIPLAVINRRRSAPAPDADEAEEDADEEEDS
jgi:hypothetical protein